MDLNQLKYPIGQYIVPQPITAQHIQDWKATLESFPSLLEKTVVPLNASQLDTPYRPEGWTVRQLVHHIADSHMNAYIRFKLGMTEDNPTIKPYEEKDWAKLSDSKLEITHSLNILNALHYRWVICLQDVEDWKKSVFHPEMNENLSLEVLLGMYAWHSQHHLAHIKNLIAREGW